ncbi:gas vesicle protein GvpO [Pseudonocardia hierapolitana]|uniref:Gas vesicle protein GvpO n=1 Tax=Pseudonocardia hierapolitana TaxID=1128676 RepID=A0A561SZ66_9PSEU|nr:gas vesicle protein GvpO [Pseudonocardia hierapolitana]
MADDEQATPRRKRRARTGDSGPEQGEETVRDEGAAEGDEQDDGEQEPGEQEHDGSAIPAPAAARRAARYIAEFTGRHPESVISVERHDGDWQVGVEVVETHRIPDTTDVLATYEVRLDGDGSLVSYRRTRRYARGQLDKECR